MLISYNWLKQLLPSLKATPYEVKERLSVTLAEVGSVKKRGEDYILEIENKALTHRPDCFSEYGLAREVAAAFDLKIDAPLPGSNELNLPKKKGGLTQELKVKVVDQTLCPRYTAVVLTNLKVAPSPNWLKTAVERLGLRSINNVVDITNYVMLQLGQPLHAFDASKLINLSGARSKELFLGIIVRSAKKGERLITLDGEERRLAEDMLLICERKSGKPIALAGIMGGEETEVDNSTTAVVLESANFEAFNNRATSRQLGLRTEASLRFEKGLDPNLTMLGLNRAIELLAKHCHGNLAGEIVDIYPQKAESKTISIDCLNANQFIGVNLTAIEIQKILNRLEIQSILKPRTLARSASTSVAGERSSGQVAAGSTFKLTIPTFRRDLNIPADIYEEIARLYGLNNLTPTLPKRSIKPAAVNSSYSLEQQIKYAMKELGFTEVYTYSFTKVQPFSGFNLFQGSTLKLQNPISPELEHLRTTLTPSLLGKTRENAKRLEGFKIFELGKVTWPSEIRRGQTKKSRGGLPNEPLLLAAVWYQKENDYQKFYYTAKGEIEMLLKKIKAKLKPTPNNSRHSLEAVIINEQGSKIGFFTAIDDSTFAFEIKLDSLIKSTDPLQFTTKFQTISLHPPVLFDLAVIVDESTAVEEIITTIQQSGGELLVNVEPFDLYFDEKTLGKGKKSIAFHLTFQSMEESLSEDGVKPFFQKIVQALKNQHQAKIRG